MPAPINRDSNNGLMKILVTKVVFRKKACIVTNIRQINEFKGSLKDKSCLLFKFIQLKVCTNQWKCDHFSDLMNNSANDGQMCVALNCSSRNIMKPCALNSVFEKIDEVNLLVALTIRICVLLLSSK